MFFSLITLLKLHNHISGLAKFLGVKNVFNFVNIHFCLFISFADILNRLQLSKIFVLGFHFAIFAEYEALLAFWIRVLLKALFADTMPTIKSKRRIKKIQATETA